MKVLRASLWLYRKGVFNPHILQILVDRIPETEEMRFEEKEGCYFAEKEGYVEEFYRSFFGDELGKRYMYEPDLEA